MTPVHTAANRDNKFALWKMVIGLRTVESIEAVATRVGTRQHKKPQLFSNENLDNTKKKSERIARSKLVKGKVIACLTLAL
jgi:hypothetical protein